MTAPFPPVADLLAAVRHGLVTPRSLADAVIDRAREERRATGLTLRELGFALDYIPVTRPSAGEGGVGSGEASSGVVSGAAAGLGGAGASGMGEARVASGEAAGATPEVPAGVTSASPLFPLAGLPIPVKDLHPVAGIPCTQGSGPRTAVPTETDASARLLLAAGATLVGSSATSELGLSCYTEPTGLPPVVNPALPGRTPGGSSGGAAALVARGIVPVAHGSDGGGSIRVPAACCGVVGFKPAHDPRGGVLRAEGFLTKTVADAAAVYPATWLFSGQDRAAHQTDLAGGSFGDPCNVHTGSPRGFSDDGPAREVTTSASLAGVRIGVLTTPLHCATAPIERHILAGLHIAADRLRLAGATIVPVTSPYPPSTIDLLRTVMSYRCSTLEDPLNDLSRYFRDTGQRIDPANVSRALAALAQVPAEVLLQWRGSARVDMVLSPTIATPPPPVGSFAQLTPAADFAAQTRWTPWCTLWNFTGWAAISIPVVRTDILGPWAGWPVSVHLGAVGHHISDSFLFSAASVVELHDRV